MGTPSRRTFLIPSVPDLVFAGLVCLQVAAASLILLNRDGDLPRHIAVGRVMLENRTLVREDFFSHTAYGQPFLAMEWGSQVIFAALYETAGLDAVAVFAAVIIGSAYALLAGFLIRRNVPLELVMTTVGLSVLIGMPHWVVRPHAFSFLLSVFLLRLLEPGSRARLLMFAPLFIVWANLHPGFLFGLTILGAVTLGDCLEAMLRHERSAAWRAAQYHAAALGVASAASLLNPFGVGLHTHSLHALGNSEIISAVAEFRSPDFHTLAGMVFLGTLLLTVAAIAMRRSRISAPTLLVFLGTLAMSLRSSRHIALFGIVALPMLSLALADDWTRWMPRVLREAGRTLAHGDRLARRGALSLVLIAVLSLMVFSDAGRADHQYIASDFDARKFPIAAVKFARDNGVSGRLYNDYMWGGYVTLAWPEQQVFIDGLADFYGNRIFQDHDEVDRLRPGWRDVLDRWKVTLVLDRADSSVVHELGRDPAWRELYRDDVAALLQRQAGVPAFSPQSLER